MRRLFAHTRPFIRLGLFIFGMIFTMQAQVNWEKGPPAPFAPPAGALKSQYQLYTGKGDPRKGWRIYTVHRYQILRKPGPEEKLFNIFPEHPKYMITKCEIRFEEPRNGIFAETNGKLSLKGWFVDLHGNRIAFDVPSHGTSPYRSTEGHLLLENFYFVYPHLQAPDYLEMWAGENRVFAMDRQTYIDTIQSKWLPPYGPERGGPRIEREFFHWRQGDQVIRMVPMLAGGWSYLHDTVSHETLGHSYKYSNYTDSQGRSLVAAYPKDGGPLLVKQDESNLGRLLVMLAMSYGHGKELLKQKRPLVFEDYISHGWDLYVNRVPVLDIPDLGEDPWDLKDKKKAVDPSQNRIQHPCP